MNTQTAQQILLKAAHLVELAATFQAHYGNDYRLKPGSPQGAWALYDEMVEVQSTIARLLSPTVLENHHTRYGKWWERQDTMNTGIAYALVQECSLLIACSVHADLVDEDKISYAVEAVQASIAGILHPASLQIGADHSIKLNVG